MKTQTEFVATIIRHEGDERIETDTKKGFKTQAEARSWAASFLSVKRGFTYSARIDLVSTKQIAIITQ